MTTRIERISLDRLIIDRRVQRQEAVRQSRIDQMAANFDLSALGTITVSERPDGTFVVLDGQHRLAAARRVGYERGLVAVVHTGLTLDEEARIFLRLNDFRAPSAVSKFHARVVAGDPIAVDIAGILDRHEWRVLQRGESGCIAAIDAVERAYTTGAGTHPVGKHPDILNWAIEVITAAWGHAYEGAHGQIVLGLAALYGRFGAAVDMQKITKELASIRPETVLGHGRTLRALQGGTLAAAIAKYLVGLHNKQRRTNRLPDWVWTH